MSYILEALKKAEQARLARKITDLQSLALSSDGPVAERLAWLYGATLAAVVVSASGLGWWFSSKPHEKPDAEKAAIVTPATRSEAAREPVAYLKLRAADALVLGGPRDDKLILASGVVSSTAPEPAAARFPDARPVEPSLRGSDGKLRGSADQADKLTGEGGSPEQKHAARPSGPASPVLDKKAGPNRAEKPVAVLPAEPPGAKLSRASRVVQLEQLPPEVRRDVPKISATGYVYSADTGVRVVNINERSLQEGDELMAGLKLEQIAPDHVLFRFRGYRFRIEMF